MVFIVNNFCYVLYFVFLNVHIVKSFLDIFQQCITTVQLLENLPVLNKSQSNASNKPRLIKGSYLKKLERLSRHSFFMQSTKCLHYDDKVQNCYMYVLKKRGFDKTKKYNKTLIGKKKSC